MNKKVALVMTAMLAVSSMSITAFAAEESATAGIGFKPTDVTIVTPPDTDLPQISTTNIYFGEHEINTVEKSYPSVAGTGANDKGDKAGFIVADPNGEGWEVKVAVSAFKTSSDEVILGTFDMYLDAETPQTTDDNKTTAAPTANDVELYPADDGSLGEPETIFSAEAGKGTGKWGCNWAGELVVPASVAKEGNGTAVMLWSLESTPSNP